MTDSTSNADLAERLRRRRARVFPILGLFLVIQQSAYFANGDGQRLVGHVRIGAWVVMSAVVLFVLTTKGFWFRSPELRAMLDDEGTRAAADHCAGRGKCAQFGQGHPNRHRPCSLFARRWGTRTEISRRMSPDACN